jgi:hypothetical protein
MTTQDENIAVVADFPVAVGTKILPMEIDMSSQRVEFEGLLVGLKYINEHWVELMEEKRKRLLESSYCVVQDDQLTLKIQGDCKTVIDQLSGKAYPRKLELQLNQARDLLGQLVSRRDVMILEYDLLPRHENCVCDCLCSNLINIMTSKAWNDCMDDLEKVQRHHDHDSLGLSCKDHSSKPAINNILISHLDPVSSMIKYSLRLHLYEQLATIATRCQDYDVLIMIGERLQEEVQRKHSRKGTWKVVKKRSVLYQIKGWRGLGNTKKAMFLEHKHRMLLQSNVEIMDNGYSILHIDDFRSLGYSQEEWEESIPKQWRDVLSIWFSEAMKHGGKDISSFWVSDESFH